MPDVNAGNRGTTRTPGVLTGLCLIAALTLVSPGHAAELTDPTRPPQSRPAPAEPAPEAPLTLDFVVNSRDRHLARINGEWVSEGDTVAGARVQRIDSDRVLVRRGGKTTVLRLSDPGVRKETAK